MDTQNVKNTIFALASGSGKSGIAVFRISGPSAQTAYQILSKKPTPKNLINIKTTISKV